MFAIRRPSVAMIVAAAVWLVSARDAHAQYGNTDSLPASAVMGGIGQDSFQSQGGVVGPWWSGSGTAAPPPASNGGFWFGLPGLGFGGSQGSTRGMNTFAPSVTSMPGSTGMISSSRLVPFVSGVVPVVGSGSSVMPVTTAAVLPLPGPAVSSLPMRPKYPVAPTPSGSMQPSTPGARDRAHQLVAAGDLRLTTGTDGPTAAKASLADYRSAIRFAKDDADIEIRQAILYEALGQRRDADRAMARAKQIDGRLGRSIETVPADAGGFLAPPPPGIPVVAARGCLILDEIAASASQANRAEPAAEQPATLMWLSEAWARRWGTTRP